MNNIHEHVLRLLYRNFNKSFGELLELDNSVPTHQINLQMLATEIYETKIEKKNSEIMNDIFRFHEPSYHFLNGNILI